MDLRKIKLVILAAAFCAAVLSCKKDDKDTILPSLDGDIAFKYPEFVKTLETITFKPEGVSHPEGKGYGYYWKVTPVMEKSDTTRYENGLDTSEDGGKESDGSFTYTFPDSLGTYTVSCYAFASDYTGISNFAYITTVKSGPEGSIAGIEYLSTDPYITVDGARIYYVNIGGTDWMRNNLYTADKGCPFRRSKVTGDIFGNYYSYEEALNACPQGWTLPSDEDWTNLCREIGAADAAAGADIPGVGAALMGDATFNTTRMWEYWPEVGEITNSSKMGIIPAGYANLSVKDSNPAEHPYLDLTYPEASFSGLYEYATFWTSDLSSDGKLARYRYIYAKDPSLKVGYADKKAFGASVRCIRK